MDKLRFHNVAVYRIVASLSIVFFHIVYIGWNIEIGHWSLLRIFMLGFTLISGFLAGKHVGQSGVWNFYKSRAKRLLIPALVCFVFMAGWILVYYLFHLNESTYFALFMGKRAINGEPMFVAGNYYYLIFFAICILITPALRKGKMGKPVVIAVIAYEVAQSFFLTVSMDSFIMVLPYVVGFYAGKGHVGAYAYPGTRVGKLRILGLVSLCLLGIGLYLVAYYFVPLEPNLMQWLHGFMRSWGIFCMTVGGTLLFLLLFRPLNRIHRLKVLDYGERRSYFVFLMDQCFVTGGTSVLWMSETTGIQVLLVFAFTLISAELLYNVHQRFFSTKVISMKDIAPGYRVRGYLARLAIPYVPRYAYPFLYWLRLPFRPPYFSSKTTRTIVKIQRDDGSFLRLVVYSPRKKAEGPRTCVVYFHGGGYGMGFAFDGRKYVELFTKNEDCVVVSVDYRLSFFHPYPSALEDAVAAVSHFYQNAKGYGIDKNQIFLAGESAGGGLAIATSLYCRDAHTTPIACVFALYPMLDDRDTPSSARHDGPIWNHRSNVEAWKAYLRGVDKSSVPTYAAPMRTHDFSGLPPIVSYVGGADAFIDEDLLFYKKVEEAGGQVIYRVFPGCYHGFDTVKSKHPMSVEAFSFLEDQFRFAKSHFLRFESDD